MVGELLGSGSYLHCYEIENLERIHIDLTSDTEISPQDPEKTKESFVFKKIIDPKDPKKNPIWSD